jgi:hypothetical protein
MIDKGGCENCISGKYQTGSGVQSEESCTFCESGKYQTFGGATACAPCNAGKFLSSYGGTSPGQCQLCQANFFSAEGASECAADCPPGTYPSTEMRCNYCISGKFLTYKGSKNSNECQGCYAGKFSTASGASSALMCQECSAGYFSLQAAELCTECYPGKYQSGLAGTAESDCISCAQGLYSTIYHASSALECKSCMTGSYSLGGSSTCTACFPGSYQTGTGENYCTSCLGGTFSNSSGASTPSVCTACQSGSYSKSNATKCTECQSGQFSTAIGSAGPCSNWKTCQLFIEAEDDSMLPDTKTDRTCLKYQYDPPLAVKIFVVFFQLPLCALACLLFLKFAPNTLLAKKTCDSPKQKIRHYRFVLNEIKECTSWREIRKSFQESNFIAPVDKSLLAAFHDFVVGIHDVVSDCTLLLLIERDAPSFFLKNVKGDLFYLASAAILGSFLVDLMIAVCCGEGHLIWLYIASCTDALPSNRGVILTITNKVLKFIVESVPIWIVQLIFLYQTYKKNQYDQNSQNVNGTVAGSQSVNTNSSQWLDYAMIFMSLLGTLMNVSKNIMSTIRILELSLYRKLDVIEPIDTIYVVNSRKLNSKVYESGKGCKGKILQNALKCREPVLKLFKALFRINPVKTVSSEELCPEYSSFSEQFVKLFPVCTTCKTEALNYPVCASVEIVFAKFNASPTELKIKFIYVLELDGHKVKKIQDLQSGISCCELMKRQCWGSNHTYEIREYYGTEHGWLANEKYNPCVERNESAMKVHDTMLEFSLMQLFQSTSTNPSTYSKWCSSILRSGTPNLHQNIFLC